MQLFQDQFYHIYNRSINHEKLFYSDFHYDYFFSKILKLQEYLEINGYCLMPSHFHLLVRITAVDQDPIRRKIGDILSGYTKSINKYYGRTGSLFQQHTKAKLISSEKYLLSSLYYIHQNPVIAGLVDNLEDWKYSSYREYIGQTKNYSIDKDVILGKFSSIEDFIISSNSRLELITM